MKYIDKSKEPQLFHNWRNSHPKKGYNDLCRKVKQKLKKSLIDEQGGLCCYCECRITKDTSHIEHFKPKGNPAFAQLQLDYQNLHASCIREPKGGDEEHCGHKKGNQFDPLLVSPLEHDCDTHFVFKLDGTIAEADERGKKTITLLHLNSALLNRQRKALIDILLESDELDTALAEHLNPAKRPLGEFYTMIKQFHNKKQL